MTASKTDPDTIYIAGQSVAALSYMCATIDPVQS